MMKKILITTTATLGSILCLFALAAWWWMPADGWKVGLALVKEGPSLYQKLPVEMTLPDGTVLDVFKPAGPVKHVAVVSLGLLGTPNIDDRSRPLGNSLSKIGFEVLMPHGIPKGATPGEQMSCAGVQARIAALNRAIAYGKTLSPSHKVMLLSVSAGNHDAMAAAADNPGAISVLGMLNPYDDFNKVLTYTIYGLYPDANGILRSLGTSPVEGFSHLAYQQEAGSPPPPLAAGTRYDPDFFQGVIAKNLSCWDISNALIQRLRAVPTVELITPVDPVVPAADKAKLAARMHAALFSTTLANHFQLLPTRGLWPKIEGGWGILETTRFLVAHDN